MKEDQSTGISKFYLCNNGGLRASFSLEFAYTRLQHIYAAKETETVLLLVDYKCKGKGGGNGTISSCYKGPFSPPIALTQYWKDQHLY